MRLFEIELNSNFSFKSKSPFLHKAEFEKFYRLNNISLSSQKNEFESYLYTDIVFKAQNYSIFVNRFTYRRDEHETLKRIINMNIYEAYYSHGKNNTRTQLTKDLFGCSEERTLYPSWLFFYIGLGRLMFDKYNQEEFINNISYFNNLSETLWKEHLILNSQNDLTFENNTVAFEYRQELYEILKDFNKKTYDKDKLIQFLKYLLRLHYIFKENEKYKLMWNLESTYILSTINLLTNDFELTPTEVVELVKVKSRVELQTDINSVYVDINSYIKENEFYYVSDQILSYIKETIGRDVNKEEYISAITSNDKYKELLYSIIEINRRFFSNKINESTVLSITEGVILNTEVFIKEKIINEKSSLVQKLKHSNKFDNQLINEYERILPRFAKGEEFFTNYYRLIEKEDSIEKCLMLYIHARNYAAHNLVEFDKFFYENNQKLIGIVINSILTILYYLETMDTQE